MNLSQKNVNRNVIASGLTALVAAISSTLCCIAPLIYLLFGVSSPWLIGLNELEFLRLPMLIISLAAFGYGFWLLHFSKRVICSQYISRRNLMILYWIMLVIILFFLFYPTFLPWFLE